MKLPIMFTDEVVQKLFGHEAAEDETLERLKQYYIKIKIYERIVADLPIRILVGHKGIGKSALFKVAMAEDEEKGNLSILIRPDDIAKIAEGTTEFLIAIREWKEGLYKIIFNKALSAFGIDASNNMSSAIYYGGKLLNFIIETVTPYIEDTKINLKPSQKVTLKEFLKTKTITIYIDDLDRGWQGKSNDIKRISALLNAIRDICNENQGLKIRIALRSDVYYLVRTSDESTDKIEGSVIWFSWTNHEILVMLIKRIETFFGRKIDESSLLNRRSYEIANYLHPIMESHFTGAGHWENAPMYRVLMSLIRKRPRDLVKLCTLAAQKAYINKSSIIRTGDFESVFEEYSQGRIQDTINEYRTELPDIERLIMNMRPNRKERKASLGYIYTTDMLIEKLKNIIASGEFKFANQSVTSPKQLAQFLYKINFLTARKILADNKIQRKYFEENRYIYGESTDYGYAWEIHPAYRWALQPDDISSVFEELELSEDDR